MKLQSIRLRNWKAYPTLDLTFNTASDERNVVIIEGANGFGKTSLLEALILGLFGRDATTLVGRAMAGGRSDVSYDSFLERALHRGVRGQDINASVELAFESRHGVRLVMQRVWYFTAAGRHRRSDEDVRMWSGPDEDLVALPDGDERAAAVRALVAHELLPLRLAPFFFFDGEHLDRLAGHDLDTQVRLGLENALGVPLLRTLSEDLHAYARERRRQLKGGAGDRLNALTDELQALEARDRESIARLDGFNAELGPLRMERDATVARIGALHGDSYANFKQLFEARERLGRDRDVLQDRLRQTLSFDLALAMAGPDLRSATRQTLAKDGEAERRDNSRLLGEERYEALIALLGTPTELKAAGLTAKQWPSLSDHLRRVWDQVWTQDADDAPRHHLHLNEADRRMVDARLVTVEGLAGETIAALAAETEAADAAVAAADQRIIEQRGADATSQSLADHLGEIQAKIGALEEASREASRVHDGIAAEIAAKQVMLSALQEQAEADTPQVARAELAIATTKVIAGLIERLLPSGLVALSGAVSEAYRAMAHKQSVERIEIAPDGKVSLLDRDDHDLRSMDPSAGESQIFAFALMAAITRLAADFPLVLDTPLARLDPDHRDRVLRFYAGLERQVIFLSQPAELSGRYLDILQPHISDIVHLAHHDGRSGQSRSTPERVEAMKS